MAITTLSNDHPPIAGAPETATLGIGDRRLELPIRRGTAGNPAIDIRELRSRTGYVTFDSGYGNTASCESQITYIDGDAGILRYRGIAIEEFETHPNFVAVAWLLIFGRLPNTEEYAAFSHELVAHADIDEAMKKHFEGFPRSAPPMAILSAMINALSCFHPEFYELHDPNQFEKAAAQFISKVRTLAAFAYRRSAGCPGGSPTGMNRTNAATAASRDPVRSTPAIRRPPTGTRRTAVSERGGRLFLESERFLERKERLLQGRHLTNVPREQTVPARPNENRRRIVCRGSTRIKLY